MSHPANLFCFLYRFLVEVESGQSSVEALWARAKRIVFQVGEVWEPCHELAVLHKGVRISYTIVASAEDRHHRMFEPLRGYLEVLHRM